MRILKEPKHVLFVWNNRMETGSDFLKGYEDILQELPEYKVVNHKNISIDELRKFIGNDEVRTVSYSNLQRFDFEGLKGRFFSSSYTPDFGTGEYYRQIAKLENLFGKCNKDGFVEYEYRTEAYLGKMN